MKKPASKSNGGKASKSGSGTPGQSETVSMATKHPQVRAAEHARARRPQNKEIEAEKATAASAAAGDDESEDEWVEVDDVDVEAEKFDMDDELSDHSLGLGDGQNDNEIEEVSAVDMPKKAGKRKKADVAAGKGKANQKRTRAKRSKCWKYFKEVNAVSKKKPGEIVTKAKCLYCYPIMAKMARKFLTVPATSVSSESAFSTGGRVLDDYRSSLRPNMVEALVCAASFIKGSKNNNIRPTIPTQDDTDDDVEFIPFPDSCVESN